MGIEVQARKAERENNWYEAEKLWRMINRTADADACRMIIDSTEKGDAYRAEVLSVAGEEPPREESHKWVAWYKKMSEIYKKHFKN